MLPKDCHENQTLLLSHAAECLAKAAITLSEAAEAISAAAKAFVSDTTSTVSVSLTPAVAQTNTEINAIVDYDSDSESSPVSDKIATPRDTNNMRRGPDESDEFKSRPTGINFMTSADDGKQLTPQTTLQRKQSGDNPTATHQPPVNDTPETGTTTQLPPSYRILLGDEADVLLAVCCLIRQSRKTVCYVRSTITSLDVYKALLAPAEVPVHIIKSFSSQEMERVVKAFRDDYSSVLLLPVNHSPSLRIDEIDSLVVYVGWPTNEELYKQQITVHQAKNNVFVAYSGDENIYPSSSNILIHAQPWPQAAQLFRNAYTALRPLFSKKLHEIPAKTKARAYTDWIITHGAAGPYHPPSWTPSILVHRANLYLLDVLGYRTGDSAHSGAEIALPEVSAGFVASQKLESAVVEGVLRVKSTPSLNHVSSLSHAGAIPAGTISLNEGPAKPMASPSLTPAPAPAARPEGSNIAALGSGPQLNKASSNINPPNLTPIPSRPASRISSNTDAHGVRTSTRQGNPLVLPRVTEYLIIESEPDVLPLICHLSTRPNSQNVICFVKVLSVFIPLTKMLEQMIAKPVFYVNATGRLFENAKQALQSPTGCLILCNMYDGLPIGLGDTPIGLTIHLGWLYHPPTYRAQIQQSSNVVILLRREIQAPNGQVLIGSLAQSGVSPASAETKRLYNRQAKTSILEPERDLLKMMLSTSTSIPSIRSSYMGFITHHYQGQYKEPGWTAIDVVTQANRYFKGLFRCGFGGDSIQGQPWVPRRFVEHLGLEAAVAAGLLMVMG